MSAQQEKAGYGYRCMILRMTVRRLQDVPESFIKGIYWVQQELGLFRRRIGGTSNRSMMVKLMDENLADELDKMKTNAKSIIQILAGDKKCPAVWKKI